MRQGIHRIVSGDETIVAISTPPGRSGVGLVRISGRQAIAIARQLFKPAGRLAHRNATVGVWLDETGQQLDQVVLTCFFAPHSYTGEDVVEISGHGNPFVLRRIVESAVRSGARIAVPGEFTLRAVANGRMDLIQAEAVREFIEAQTEQQARTALRQMEGTLSRRVRPVKEQLVDVIARLEAGIDFAEDDVHIPPNHGLIDLMRPLLHTLEQLQESFGYGRMLAAGLKLAIIGKPNVGKSSLFNRFVAAERSIVTDLPGTTRDVVTESISLDGIPWRVADTAGVRQTSDVVESMGVNRTLGTLPDADLVLVIIDGSCAIDDEDRRVLSEVRTLPHYVVINKSDLPEATGVGLFNGTPVVKVSAKTGAGLEDLREAIQRFVTMRRTDFSDDSMLTSERQHDEVVRAIAALRAAEKALCENVPHEMVLLDCYRALSALDELTGEVVSDDILGRIFSTFCIGK